MKPLRVCQVCGIEAQNQQDLELFKKHKFSLHGRLKLCKKCYNDKKTRTADFIEVFRERSSDGRLICHFCEEEVTKLLGQDGDSLAIHSLDDNHENWDPKNKVPTHNACHSRHHNTGERSYNWKGDEASDDAKSKRKWTGG